MLYPVLGLGSVAFWVGSVLIDADHYLEFIYHNKLTDFSIRRMLEYHYTLGKWIGQEEFLNLSIFHTVEFLALFYLGAVWLDSPMLKAFLWGMVYHRFLDTIYLARLGYASKRVHSIVEFFIRKELIKRNGLHPVTVCNRALDEVLQGNTGK